MINNIEETIKALIDDAVREAINNTLPNKLNIETRQPVYTINDVCKMFQVSKRHMQYLRDSGQIGYIKNCRKILFRWEDLEAFFNQNYVKGARSL
jgi:DNA-directed RNA polymerase beta' subunit